MVSGLTVVMLCPASISNCFANVASLVNLGLYTIAAAGQLQQEHATAAQQLVHRALNVKFTRCLRSSIGPVWSHGRCTSLALLLLRAPEAAPGVFTEATSLATAH